MIAAITAAAWQKIALALAVLCAVLAIALAVTGGYAWTLRAGAVAAARVAATDAAVCTANEATAETTIKALQRALAAQVDAVARVETATAAALAEKERDRREAWQRLEQLAQQREHDYATDPEYRAWADTPLPRAVRERVWADPAGAARAGGD